MGPHNVTEHQRPEHVRISEEILKLLDYGGRRLISKIIATDGTHIPFFDVSMYEENKVWVFKNDLKPKTVKKP